MSAAFADSVYIERVRAHACWWGLMLDLRHMGRQYVVPALEAALECDGVRFVIRGGRA